MAMDAEKFRKMNLEKMNSGPRSRSARMFSKKLKSITVIGGVVGLLALAVYPVWIKPMRDPKPWRKL